MNRNSYQIGGLNVVTVKTDKFKTTNILLNFRNKLQAESATARALVPYVLRAGTEQFPSKKTISRELERLYGASFGTNINKQGLQQIISFKLSMVNDRYLQSNDSLLDDAFQFLNEIILKPQMENGHFLEKTVNTEKRLLSEYFDSLYDNKIRYAYDRLLDEMFKDETYRVRSAGKKDDIEQINHKTLTDVYRTMIKEDTVELFIIGDVNEARVKELVQQYLPFETREPFNQVIDTEEKTIEKVNEIVEEQTVSQAKLNLGLRTHTRGTEPDYTALLVLNGILGSYPHSLLFRNVREKHSLCYYISSTVDKAKGAMFIYAGIEHTDYNKARDITLEQIDAIKQGQFSKEILENTKNAMVNDLLEIKDSPTAILATDYSSLLYGEIFDIDKKIAMIKAVTFDDVVNVSQKIELDTIFLLTTEGVKA